MRSPLRSSPLPEFPGVTRKKSRHILTVLGILAALCLFVFQSNYWHESSESEPSLVVKVAKKEFISNGNNQLLLQPSKDPSNEVLSKKTTTNRTDVTTDISSIEKLHGSATVIPPNVTTPISLLRKSENLRHPNWNQMKNISKQLQNAPVTILNEAPSAGNSQSNYADPFKYFTFENAPFAQYALNVQLSQSLPLHRPIPEFRVRTCLGRKYPLSRPHKVSVIVPFYNEMWAVLMRTIRSLLNHSPAELLHEIIMVDDFSNFDNLLGPLTAYVKTLPKVKLVRLKQREGLIRARMVGARMATGNLLAFIDAHVETTVGWLEPLVSLVTKERTTIAVPVIQSIDPLSFEFAHVPLKSTGVFTWDLDYVWKDEDVRYAQIGVEPHPTATMIGCAFLVDREFFFNVGSFDEGMDIWGGEQIEISFRTWMCGGSVKIVPCSHVGHIYRAHLPYAFDKYILYRNLQRIAEVWMDDYKRYYYYTIQADPHKFTLHEQQTVQGRKDLRRKLQCKSFSWYLQTVAPHVMAPTIGATLVGNIRNIGSQNCLIQKDITKFDFNEVGFEFCSLQTKNLTFSYMDSGHLMYNGMCLAYQDTKDSAVVLALCDQNDSRQLWLFQSGIPPAYQNRILGADVKRTRGSFQLKYGAYNLCLSQMMHEGSDIAGALDCGAMNVHQYWIVTYQMFYGRDFTNIYPEIRQK